MKSIARFIALVLFFLPNPGAAQDNPAVIGRITEITGGQLLRYDSEAREWVQMVADSPFGIEDALYTEEQARSEILIPNGTLVRLDGNTQILTISLDDDLTHLRLSSGLSRVISRDNGAGIEITTGFGSVLVPSGAIADVAADAQGATVIAVGADVQVVTEGGATFQVKSGDALHLTGQSVESIAATPAPSWAEWNLARDRLWASRAADAASAHHLPATLVPYTYELDAYGEWRSVFYAGGYHWLWCPTRIAAGWAPYTYGRWVTWYADPCWIPDEPFGYVTHHYGSWEFIHGLWFWVPPGVGINIGLGLGWYPGRVGWVSYGSYMGWYPLLWNEPWYAHRRWGVHSRPYAGYRPGHHHHAGRAVVIDQQYFHRGRSYARHRHRGFDPHRFKSHRNPYQISGLAKDPRRFYTTGAPAIRIPGPAATAGVRRHMEDRHRSPSAFRPSGAKNHRHPPLKVKPSTAAPAGPKAKQRTRSDQHQGLNPHRDHAKSGSHSAPLNNVPPRKPNRLLNMTNGDQPGPKPRAAQQTRTTWAPKPSHVNPARPQLPDSQRPALSSPKPRRQNASSSHRREVPSAPANSKPPHEQAASKQQAPKPRTPSSSSPPRQEVSSRPQPHPSPQTPHRNIPGATSTGRNLRSPGYGRP